MTCLFAPLGFPIYGLGDTWDGPRWLENVAGECGGSARTIWLGHGTSRHPSVGSPWMCVGSTPVADLHDVFRDDWEREAALDVLVLLVNLTYPSLPGPDAATYRKRSVAWAEKEAEVHREWQETGWICNGRSSPARVVRWAGAWAGFVSEPIGAVAVDVFGVGIEPGEIGLKERNPSDYQLSTEAAFDAHVVLPASQQDAFRGQPHAERPVWPLHADQRRLLDRS